MGAFWRRTVAVEMGDRIAEETRVALNAAREELTLPFAGLKQGGRIAIRCGDDAPQLREIDLGDGARLVVGLRAGASVLSRTDEEALRSMSPWLAEVMHAQRLVGKLAAGRSVRRVQRQRRAVPQEQGPVGDVRVDVNAVLAGLADDALQALVHLRAFVEELQRRVLGGYGLVGALRAWAETLRDPSGLRVWVEVKAPLMLPELPAIVEVTAYAIVTEALTNTAWHSGSRTAQVVIEVRAGKLLFEIRDHGHGIGGQRAGSGLERMRERTAHVGGTFEFESTPHGVVVGAALPLEPVREPIAL